MRKRIGGSAVIESASACRVEARECRKVFGAALRKIGNPEQKSAPRPLKRA